MTRAITTGPSRSVEQALKLRFQALGSSHPQVATTFNNLAELHRMRGNRACAAQLYDKAIGIWRHTLPDEHPSVMAALNNLAGLNRAKGEYGKAVANLQRVLAYRKKTMGADHPAVATTLNNLAELLRMRGDYEEAEKHYKKAFEIKERTFGSQHPHVATILHNRAILYQTKGEIDQALEFMARGTDVREHNLVLILATGSEEQKRAYTKTLVGETNSVITLHTKFATQNDAARDLAFTTVLRRKGRVLEAVTDNLAILRRRLDPEAQRLLTELAAVRARLATLVRQGPGRKDLAQYSAEITRLTALSEQLEAQISARSASFRTQVQPVTLATVQEAIPPEAALVEIVAYRPFDPTAPKPTATFGPTRYAAYILYRKGEPTWVDLGEATPIDRAVAELRGALSDPSRTDAKSLARALDEVVMRPIRPWLGDAHVILLSPDSVLNLLPFGALVDEQGRYLIERYAFTYLTSGRDLLRFQVQAQSKSGPVIFANPDYNSNGIDFSASFELTEQSLANLKEDGLPTKILVNLKPLKNQQFNTEDKFLEAVEWTIGKDQTVRYKKRILKHADFSKPRWRLLPRTEEEAEILMSLLPGATVLTWQDATEEALKGVRGPQILHVATHGFFEPAASRVITRRASGTEEANAYNPLLRAGLVLAGVNSRKSGGEDGVLTALEMSALDLSGTQLVVLSACETGIGEVQTGEGVYGFRRALVLAGAESQVMSLWIVSSMATRELMMAYYQGLQEEGLGRSEALHRAQRALLSRADRQHPYYWAGFVSLGHLAPLQQSGG